MARSQSGNSTGGGEGPVHQPAGKKGTDHMPLCPKHNQGTKQYCHLKNWTMEDLPCRLGLGLYSFPKRYGKTLKL